VGQKRVLSKSITVSLDREKLPMLRTTALRLRVMADRSDVEAELCHRESWDLDLVVPLLLHDGEEIRKSSARLSRSAVDNRLKADQLRLASEIVAQVLDAMTGDEEWSASLVVKPDAEAREGEI